MNYLKNNPKGLDVSIENIQKKLFTLGGLWGVDIDGYPRCYVYDVEGQHSKYSKDARIKEKTIAHYISKTEYKHLIHQERNKFFFLCENIKQIGLQNATATVELFFILNLKQCKPNSVDRADFDVLEDVLKILNKCFDVSVEKTIETSEKKIFQGYNYEENINAQPYFCFKITFNINEFNLFQKPC